ncbi:B-cell receptor CD22-like isoform X2 [Amphiprion ocellaris]|uniref:B-cell receptor CD22-like isoform X2 n=1 Tax=Amphiprion ocellaris TaxID=80972 RepID=UPI002410EF46|nr:B-cell receptor CD22-like isoform X2 [Amphiprion ocellaris]
MSLTAAASGFVVLLFCVPVVQGQDDWGVTFTSTEICAVKGATVEMSCDYKHPTYMYGNNLTVQETFWFIKDLVDLTTVKAYTDRVQYSCDGKRCTLRIRDLRKSDSAVYKFRFITNPPEGRYSSPTGVTLSVTDLHVYVPDLNSYKKTLTCHSDCPLPAHPTYVWYKNGHDIGIATRFHSGNFQYEDGISCALGGFEDFPSDSVCVRSKYCNKVNYNNRRICALRGSSVVISCTYQSYRSAKSLFWFSPQQSHQWSSSSKPEDISKDSQYGGRVQVDTWSRGSSLTIRELRETDSAEYRFKFKTSMDEWESDLHGTTVTVTALQVHVTRISDSQRYTHLQLKCLSSCTPSGHSYVWFKNGQKMNVVTSSLEDWFYLGDRISCALKTHEQHASPEVYPPKPPSLSASPSAEIMEGSSVNLTCRTDANPAANSTWYKRNGNPALQSLSNESQLVFSSIQSSDSGLYYCTVENTLGKRTSKDIGIDVKYAPKIPSVSVSPSDAPQLPSMSVSPSGEIMEGSSVNLTCSSDANPKATCTWYKGNQTLQGHRGIFYLTFTSSEDSGTYYCRCENIYGQINSTPAFIDVQYAPKLLSVSMSPSGEIVEGSSVNLTCNSDANPEATYTWYKENEDSSKASGRTFTITNATPQHSGKYYCEVRNSRGHHNSSLDLIIVPGPLKSAAVGSITVIVLAIIFLSAFLLIRRQWSLKKTSESRENPDNTAQDVDPQYDTPSAAVKREPAEQQDDLYYSSVRFCKKQEDPLYSNIMLAWPKQQKEEEEEEDVEYTAVSFNNGSPGWRHQEAVENPSAVYSTVNKNHRL